MLEAWYREELGKAEIDISSSGVQAYTFAELRHLLDLRLEELDEVLLDDSDSFGAPRLRRAIAGRYAPGRADHVLASHGSSEAIALVLDSLLKAGQRVVVADPLYHSLRRFAELNGCEVIRLPVAALTADLDRACSRVITPGTRAVVVNFPHNPTGAVLGAGEIDRLVEHCGRLGAWLFWDGAMEELPMEGPVQAVWPAPRDHVIRFGTLSKAFGLPGLRVGWCLAVPDLLRRTLALRDRTTLFLSPLVELLAARAIERADRLIQPRRERARRNLDVLDDWVRQNDRVVRWRRPAGGVCGLLEVRGVADTEPFCRRLLHETGVLLVPGRAFDAPHSVRIGYGGCDQRLQIGLRRLGAFLNRA